jgi:hypothetical protein
MGSRLSKIKNAGTYVSQLLPYSGEYFFIRDSSWSKAKKAAFVAFVGTGRALSLGYLLASPSPQSAYYAANSNILIGGMEAIGRYAKKFEESPVRI